MCVLIQKFLTNFTGLDFEKEFDIFDVLVSSCEGGIRKVGLFRGGIPRLVSWLFYNIS
jgi:hypothetical protein